MHNIVRFINTGSGRKKEKKIFTDIAIEIVYSVVVIFLVVVSVIVFKPSSSFNRFDLKSKAMTKLNIQARKAKKRHKPETLLTRCHTHIKSIQF